LSETADVTALAKHYKAKTDDLDVTALAKMASDSIERAIADKNIPDLLKWYDNKGMLSLACKAKGTSKTLFEQWIVRMLRNNSAPEVSTTIRNVLPSIVAT
jgi:hypothetical protein